MSIYFCGVMLLILQASFNMALIFPTVSLCSFWSDIWHVIVFAVDCLWNRERIWGTKPRNWSKEKLCRKARIVSQKRFWLQLTQSIPTDNTFSLRWKQNGPVAGVEATLVCCWSFIQPPQVFPSRVTKACEAYARCWIARNCFAVSSISLLVVSTTVPLVRIFVLFLCTHDVKKTWQERVNVEQKGWCYVGEHHGVFFWGGVGFCGKCSAFCEDSEFRPLNDTGP